MEELHGVSHTTLAARRVWISVDHVIYCRHITSFRLDEHKSDFIVR